MKMLPYRHGDLPVVSFVPNLWWSRTKSVIRSFDPVWIALGIYYLLQIMMVIVLLPVILLTTILVEGYMTRE